MTEFGQKDVLKLLSLAFRKNGDLIVVYLTLERKTRISLFSESGQFIREITNEHVKEAYRLSVAPNGNIILYDLGDKKIKVLSPDGEELFQSFSTDIPADIIYRQETFFVSLPCNHVVRVYNKEGVFLYDIGGEGFRGLAIDKFNNLIVCDSYKSALQVFALDGQFVNLIGELNTKLLLPFDVAVSKTGRVYVTERATHSEVHVFQ